MRISVTVVAADTAVSNDFIPLEVFPDMTLDDVKGFVEDEIKIASSAQKYIINNQVVTQTSRSLTDLGINDGDVLSLAIQTKPSAPAPQQSRPAQRKRGEIDPETMRLQILGNQEVLANVREQNPELADAANDPERFRRIWEDISRQRIAAQMENERKLAYLNENFNDPEAQAKIAEMIRQERVLENYQKAYEENPEAFGSVIMLYIDVLVNNVPIKAFVDSGAQSTIMSPTAAEKCGIMRLIDTRFSGIARGVGTAKILGRVHSADLQIGQFSLASSFTVMEGKDVDLLLGLDMLKRHQMCIDLKDNCLRVAGENVPFLPESEIPKMTIDEPKIEGPGGTTIGATTGTVEQAGPSATAGQTTASSSGSRIKIHPSGSAGNIHTNTEPGVTSSSSQSSTQPLHQQQPQPSQPSRGGFDAPASITEQSIAQTMEISGLSRQACVTALEQANGNVELALGLLL